MEDEQYRELKEELGRQAGRLDNVEGYFDNFNTTLNNHMNSYDENQRTLQKWGWRGFWLLFTLDMMLLGSLIALAIKL